jgi:hypothetical protein
MMNELGEAEAVDSCTGSKGVKNWWALHASHGILVGCTLLDLEHVVLKQ